MPQFYSNFNCMTGTYKKCQVIYHHHVFVNFSGSAPSPIHSPDFYRPKRSFGQGNVFTGVCDSVHGGGSPIFRGGGLHRNTVNVRPVRILLECILVIFFISKQKRHPYEKSWTRHWYFVRNINTLTKAINSLGIFLHCNYQILIQCI